MSVLDLIDPYGGRWSSSAPLQLHMNTPCLLPPQTNRHIDGHDTKSIWKLIFIICELLTTPINLPVIDLSHLQAMSVCTELLWAAYNIDNQYEALQLLCKYLCSCKSRVVYRPLSGRRSTAFASLYDSIKAMFLNLCTAKFWIQMRIFNPLKPRLV